MIISTTLSPTKTTNLPEPGDLSILPSPRQHLNYSRYNKPSRPIAVAQPRFPTPARRSSTARVNTRARVCMSLSNFHIRRTHDLAQRRALACRCCYASPRRMVDAADINGGNGSAMSCAIGDGKGIEETKMYLNYR